ncbi:inositol monophosphatase family protein [Pelagibacterium halotolerans]|uniref:inositol monophosphatase family protein n=1 Tax=Pelagibacterium halotolerans TaxID=531813 RepID=UPI003850B4EF
MSLAHRRTAAEAILREAGKRALEHFEARSFSVEEKGVQDFVSEVDRQTEIFIRESLAALFPDDTFLGEEGGGEIAASSWIVDPIDGTTNFVRGIPFWCLSAGFVVDGEPTVGVIYDPCRDEMFSAHKGGGAMLNGKPIRVSTTSAPKQALLSIGYSFKSPATRHHAVIDGLFSAGAMYRMHGAGALALAQVAAGRMDGFWEAIIYPWDVAAGLTLVQEAGGIVSDFFAGDDIHKGHEILATAPGMKDFFGALTGIAV